jgi:hypothetical protein
MSHHMLSPLDLHEPELEGSGLGWTFATIVIATLILLFANAVSLRDWIDDLPPSPAQAQAAEFADQWVGITEAMGIAAPRDFLHAQWKRAEEVRFHAKGGKGEAADGSAS